MANRFPWILSLSAVLLGCGSDDSGDSGDSQQHAEPDAGLDAGADVEIEAGFDAATEVGTDALVDSPAEASGTFTLTVDQGYGSGTHAAGDTVHVWAGLRPWSEILTGWGGDTDALHAPSEWHTTLTMPARNITVEALWEVRDETFEESTYQGTTSSDKTVIAHVPEDPRGLILLLHGTNGSAKIIEKPEGRYLALAAIGRGYGVLATEAEEVAAGDADGDGKERWDPSLKADNVDFANLDALVIALRQQGLIDGTVPLYVMGMSNGGAMSVSLGAVSASPVASAFPNLRFEAALSYCASGRTGSAEISETPTAWFLCANDDNEQVSNAKAEENSAALEARGITTVVDAHPPSPLYDQRFMRVPGVDEATSTAIAEELRAAGFVDDDGMITVSSRDIVDEVGSSPGDFPTIVALSGSDKLGVVNQMRVMLAEHRLYSDWASRALDFFDAES